MRVSEAGWIVERHSPESKRSSATKTNHLLSAVTDGIDKPYWMTRASTSYNFCHQRRKQLASLAHLKRSLLGMHLPAARMGLKVWRRDGRA